MLIMRITTGPQRHRSQDHRSLVDKVIELTKNVIYKGLKDPSNKGPN